MESFRQVLVKFLETLLWFWLDVVVAVARSILICNKRHVSCAFAASQEEAYWANILRSIGTCTGFAREMLRFYIPFALALDLLVKC